MVIFMWMEMTWIWNNGIVTQNNGQTATEQNNPSTAGNPLKKFWKWKAIFDAFYWMSLYRVFVQWYILSW